MARHNKGPRIELNDSGYYEIRWTEEGRSKRLSTGASEVLEATTFLAGWLHEKGRDKTRIPTVRAILESYLKERDLLAKSPRQESAIRCSLLPLLGDIPVDALTADRINEYCETRQELPRPACSGTIRRELGVLIAGLNHAKKQHRIDGRIIPHIQLPDGSDPRTETFSALQLEQVIALVAPKDGERCSRICRFFWLSMETAKRRRSVETLSWSKNVDFKNGMINPPANAKAKKVKRQGSVPISSRLAPMLQRFYEERENDFVLDHDGQAYVAWGWLMNQCAEEYCDDSFATKVPHDLRRTWATQAAQSGVSLWDIAGVLADTVATVSKHYAHHMANHLRGAVDFRQNQPSGIGA